MLSSSCLLQGLIKIRGDKCWLDLTCMDFHYEVSTDLACSSQRSLHSPCWAISSGYLVLFSAQASL